MSLSFANCAFVLRQFSLCFSSKSIDRLRFVYCPSDCPLFVPRPPYVRLSSTWRHILVYRLATFLQLLVLLLCISHLYFVSRPSVVLQSSIGLSPIFPSIFRPSAFRQLRPFHYYKCQSFACRALVFCLLNVVCSLPFVCISFESIDFYLLYNRLPFVCVQSVFR